MTNENKQKAITVIKNVLSVLHGKQYERILDYVDESEIEDIDSLFDCVQGTLEINGFDAIDEYGVPCNFNPKYEYSQMEFYEYDDKSGFVVEYDLTSESELVDLCLQMKFLYVDSGLKSIFKNIDPQ